MVEVKSAANKYLSLGFSVIPTKLDKTPLLTEWRSFQKRHALYSEIEEWYDKWPDAGVAIITGAISNLVVVDIDSPDAVKMLQENKDKIRDAPVVVTGKGYHLYYKYRSGVGNSVNRELGIDIRGEGGYVIAPPSKHPYGRNYRWSKKAHPWNTTMVELPDIFYIKQPEYRGNETDEQHWAVELFEGVTEGGRNDACARLAGRLILKGLGEQEVQEIMAMWNIRNSPSLPDAEVRRTVESIMASHRRKQ